MMLRIRMGLAALCMLGMGLSAFGQKQVDAQRAAVDSDSGGGPEEMRRCAPVTIAQGEFSGWGADLEGFRGAEIVIRDPESWQAFWRVHSHGRSDAPRVDFRERLVLAALLGHQRTSGGPSITIADLADSDVFPRVIVIDDERPGDRDEPSNPFHIVSVARRCVHDWRSAAFQHRAPRPGSGAVAGHVFGVGRGDEQVPLAGAHVALWQRGEVVHEARAGRDGSYRFGNVQPGEYLAVARHAGFLPAEARILVEPDRVTRQPFLLEPRPTGAIAGQVSAQLRDREPEPLPGALVRLFRGDREIAHTRANDRGAYAFDPVAVGEYRLLASHPDFLPEDAHVVVRDGEVTEQNFVLEARDGDHAGAFAGAVFGGRGDERIPLGGAIVRVMAGDEIVGRAETNDRGQFRVEPLRPGEYRALAEAEGHLPEDAHILIRAGEVTEFVFHLHRAPAPLATP